MIKLSIILSLFAPLIAHSYPKFVGHGYNNCMVCHYNSQGNGPLTDYGRALGASEISGKLFRPSKTDEELGKESNFLFMKKPLPFGIRPSINYRGLLFSDNVGDGDVIDDVWGQAQYINMQVSANVAIKLDEKDKFTVVAEMSYNPDDKSDQENLFRSREYYFRYMPNKNWVAYAGLMDKVFGVRFENHYLFSKNLLGLSQDDQSHGFTGVYQDDSLEITGQYFLGNIHIEGDTEQSGLSAKAIYKPNTFSRIGVSFLSSSSIFTEKTYISMHGEYGLGHGSSVIGEYGRTTDTVVSGANETSGSYFLIQGTLRPWRGFYVYQTFEYIKPDSQSENYTMRIGPGIQWFVNQGLEYRIDLLNKRSLSFPEQGSSTSFKDDWELLSQVHIWL
jgi:hypothetical protein